MITAYEYLDQNKDTFLEQYIELIRIPSISTQPEHAADVQRAAEWLQAKMLAAGMTKADVIKMPEGRHPLVLGEWDGAGENAKTVIIYCHYDVQPAAMEDGWHTNPFEPTIKDGRLYARGSVDSKLHVMSQLKAIECVLAADEKPNVNIKLILEGEEESGSENINAFVEKHAERLRADYGVISDGTILDNQPSLVYGLRGITTLELHIRGPQQDLHSGHFGGTTHNPIQALCEIIAQLHDDNGTVTVPGFYDDVLLLDDTEREALKHVNTFTEREWKEVSNAPQFWGEAEYTIHERMGARPTLEINGIGGGYIGDGFKTVLPHHAMAKISCRLVANQDPNRIAGLVRDHILALTPPTVTAEIIKLETGAPAVLLDRETRSMQTAAQAYERGWGKAPIFARAGGSVPITSEMQKLADEIVLMGFGYKSGVAHGPNENIYIESFYKGITSAITFLLNIG